jgi:hypothetical protein
LIARGKKQMILATDVNGTCHHTSGFFSLCRRAVDPAAEVC